MKTSVLNILVIQASIQAIVYWDLIYSKKLYLQLTTMISPDKYAGMISCFVYNGKYRPEGKIIDTFGPQQSDPIATVFQLDTDCNVTHNGHDVYTWCGPGSGVRGESIQYIIVKSGFGAKDAGLYYCRLRKSGLTSSRVLLLFPDPVLHITTSAPYATSSVHFKLTCVVNKARGMLNGLYVRLYLIIEYALGIVQYYDTCYWKYTKEEYSGRFRAECGSGTNTYRAEERKYIFTILKPKPTDKSFVCAMKLAKMQNERKVKSKTFRLQFYAITLKLIPPPLRTRTPVGVKFNFTCMLQDAANMNYTVCFYTQNDREWCLRQTMANCVELNSTDNHNNTDGYIVKCGEGTSSTTPQKQYLLTILNTSAIDETGWWCQLKFMKEGSKVTFLIVEDFTLSLGSDDPYVTQRNKYLFKCLLTDAAYVNDTLCFHRQDDHSWCITQQLNRCNHSVADQNYILTCGNGTSNTNITLKVYFLEIRNASAIDGNTWWCQLTDSGARSNPFNLKVQRFSLTLKSDAPYVIAGKKSLLLCVVKDASNMVDTLCFHRQDNHSWCINQTLDDCVPSTADAMYNVTCANGTYNRDTFEKVYSLEMEQTSSIDAKKWWCDMEKNGARSNIVSLEILAYELSPSTVGMMIGFGILGVVGIILIITIVIYWRTIHNKAAKISTTKLVAAQKTNSNIGCENPCTTG